MELSSLASGQIKKQQPDICSSKISSNPLFWMWTTQLEHCKSRVKCIEHWNHCYHKLNVTGKNLPTQRELLNLGFSKRDRKTSLWLFLCQACPQNIFFRPCVFINHLQKWRKKHKHDHFCPTNCSLQWKKVTLDFWFSNLPLKGILKRRDRN